jgi:hypothetical protein
VLYSATVGAGERRPGLRFSQILISLSWLYRAELYLALFGAASLLQCFEQQ